MKLQDFGFVLALVALLPCLIEGRSEQNYLNGILFEAPADVPKSDSVGKFSFEEFHNELVPIFEILPAHLPLSKLKDKNEFKKFLETELLYDAPEDVLYDTRDGVAAVYSMVESVVGLIPGGSIVTGILDLFGVKDAIINLIGGEKAKESDLERKALLEKVKVVLKSMEGMLGNLFNEAVEKTAAETMEIAVNKEKKHWRQRMRRLKKKLARQTKNGKRNIKRNPNIQFAN